MNLFISSTFEKDNKSFYDVLQSLLKNQIFNVEIGSNHCYEDNYDYIKDYKNFNFLVHNYFPVPKNDIVINIASQDDYIRKKSIKHIFSSIDFCKEIDSKLYTFHPGFLTDPSGSNLSSDNYDFQWKNSDLNNLNYKKSFDNMFLSLDKIVNYANKRKVKVSIETEGSINRKEHLLMQYPEEYIKFMNEYNNNDLNINLNIGHLILASKAFNFKINEFINLIQDYIIAFELSHNNGIEDDHLPLKDNEWYWDFIFDKRFKDAFKILEFRNVKISDLIKNIELFKMKYNAI